MPEASRDEPEDPDEAAIGPRFVKEGWGSAQTIALLGVGVLLSAVVAVAVTAKSGWFPLIVLTLYHVILHTLTGLLAVIFAAWLSSKPLGKPELAAARMFIAVCLAQLVMNLNLPPWAGAPAALAAYALTTAGLFRLPLNAWLAMLAAHAGLWFFFYAGAQVEVWGRIAK